MYIGIDIGGHKINSVLMRNNKIIQKRKVPTKSISNKEIMIAQIFDCIENLIAGIDRKKIKGIGIGVPAPVNVTALKNVSLAEIVRREFKIKTKVDNDANCFGLAEAILGAGRSAEILAGLTLGTGIGGAIIVKGEIFHGVSNSAAEFGHMIIKKDGRRCDCGNRGCLEAYLSVKRREEYLGIGLANIVNIFNPDIIVIGGGIVDAGKFLFEPARKIMRKNILSPLAKNTKVVKAKLGEDAGAIGATLLLKT
jgi:glucokinase